MFPNPGDKPPALSEADKWIIEEMNSIIEHAIESYDAYDFHSPATRVKHFIWETFASHYIELVKNRAYNKDGIFTAVEQSSAHYTLHHVLENVLKILAPILPFLTHRLYMDLRGEDIHFTSFPVPGERFKPDFTTQELEELNGVVWKTKKEGGASLRDEVTELRLPSRFRGIIKDLTGMHNIGKISYKDEIKVVLQGKNL